MRPLKTPANSIVAEIYKTVFERSFGVDAAVLDEVKELAALNLRQV
jgi:hypothetical protein